MIMTATADDVATVTLNGHLPARMTWRGEEWDVIDRPTEPEGFYWSTHPPTRLAWRFTARNPSGESMVFDITREGRGPVWRVVKTYL